MQRSRLGTAVLIASTCSVLLAACSRTESEKAAAPAAKPAAPPAAASPAYPTRVYFGDTHLHTALSMDAGAAGAKLMPADGVIHDWMNPHAVKQDRRGPILTEQDIQASNYTRAIFEGPVRDAGIRTER